MALMSAARLTQLWEKDLTREFFDEYDRWPGIVNDVVHTSDNGEDHYIKEGLMASFGSAPQVYDGQAFPFDAFYQGPEKLVYFNEYGFAAQSTRVMMEDDRQDVMKKIAREQAKAMAYTIELQGWDLINSGFVTTARVGLDSQALFASAHPMYGPQGGTISNLLTGSLSKLNMQAAMDKFAQLVNERNIPIYAMPPFQLLIHPLNRWMAEILGASEYDPDSAGNSVNVVKEKFTFKMVPFFTSTTTWVLADKKMHDLRWVWRRKIKYEPAMDFITGNCLWKAHMRALATFFHWRGVVGSTG
jgi:hypothetical protein